MADERMITLLKQKSVGCTLRKQPEDLTAWFYVALKIYGELWIRPDKDTFPVKAYIEDLFTYLKFVALPNNSGRKRDLILTKWPTLRDKIAAL
jgi:hypothetical protein